MTQIADRSPLYIRIARDMLAAIEAGDHPVGALLPTEQELCERLGVSRITIRGAMRELEVRGVVSRQPGVGTRVEQAGARDRFIHESTSIEDVLQFTQEMSFRRTSQRKVKIDAKTAASIGASEGDAFMRIEGVRVAAGAHICHSTHFIPFGLAASATDFNGHKGSLASMMARRLDVDIDELDQTLEAINLDTDLSKLFGVPAGDAALATWRRYRDDRGRLLIATRSIFPKDRYTYTLRNRRERAMAERARPGRPVRSA